MKQQLSGAVFCQMQTDRRGAPCNGAADIEEIRIPLGPRAEDGVGKNDRVRLAPGDLLSERGTHFCLIGRTGPGWDGAHAPVGGHLAIGLARPLGGDRPLLPVMLVQAADIQSRRHGDLCSQAGKSLGKLQAGIANVNGAVDMRAGDIQQLACPCHLCHAGNDGHGHPGSRTIFSVQHFQVVI